MIAVQVENEYGSFSKDGSYMEYIKEVRIVFFAPGFLLFLPNFVPCYNVYLIFSRMGVM